MTFGGEAVVVGVCVDDSGVSLCVVMIMKYFADSSGVLCVQCVQWRL